jgi:hypothetical protein
MKKIFSLIFILAIFLTGAIAMIGCDGINDTENDKNYLLFPGIVGPQGPAGQSCTVEYVYPTDVPSYLEIIQSPIGIKINCGNGDFYVWNGIDGKDGENGVSCGIVSFDGGATVSCGDNSVNILNGVDGAQGPQGIQGSDGQSCTVETVDNGIKINCGTGDYYVYNGETGLTGKDGQDGVSVNCSSSTVTNGTLVTCTDGTSFTVLNGTDGKDGKDGTCPICGQITVLEVKCAKCSSAMCGVCNPSVLGYVIKVGDKYYSDMNTTDSHNFNNQMTQIYSETTYTTNGVDWHINSDGTIDCGKVGQ